MKYRIDIQKCLQCALCVSQCPQKAIDIIKTVKEADGLMRYTAFIDPKKCTSCDVCFSHEWWCPAKAIVKG